MLRYENSVILLRPFILFLAALCLLGLFSTEVTDTDFWWHLKTGQYVIEHKALPVPDPFAYTTAMQPAPPKSEAQVQHFNLTHEWLAQVLMYAAYSIGGIPAVIFVRAFLLAALCGIAGWLASRRSRDGQRSNHEFLGLLAAFASSTIAILFASDRPALASFLLTGVFILILEQRRWLWSLPVLALLWANLHGGFFLGWLVLLAYVAEAWVKQQEDRKFLSLIAGAAFLLSGLNPNGFGVLSTLIQYRDSALTKTLVEWQRPYLWGQPYAFDVLLYAALAVLLFSWRKVRISDWILFAAFAAAALTAYRNIILIGFLAPVLIAAYFPWQFFRSIKIPQSVLTYGTAVLLLLGIGTGIARGSFFQWRMASKMPAGAADYLQAHPPAGALLNTYELGGYLIWRLGEKSPANKVFIDGRALSESVFRDYQTLLYNSPSTSKQITGDRAELLKHYNIQTVVMNTVEYVSGTLYPLALALGNADNADWQLVYVDAQALIFVNHPPNGTPVYPNKALRVVQQMEAECTAHIEHFPSQPLCARTLADLWGRSGDRNHARDLLGLYLSHAQQSDREADAAYRQLVQPPPAVPNPVPDSTTPAPKQ